MAKETLKAALYNTVNQHKLKLSVTLFENFHQMIPKSISNMFWTFHSGQRCVSLCVRTTYSNSPKEVALCKENKRWLANSYIKSNECPLTRKLPFAQVLGFALLSARHVALVAAFQLSSHWEIRPYKGRLQMKYLH